MRIKPLALIALIASIIGPVSGINIGHIALKQIKSSNEPVRGFANAALVVGYIYTPLILIFVLFYVFVFAEVFSGPHASQIAVGKTLLPNDENA